MKIKVGVAFVVKRRRRCRNLLSVFSVPVFDQVFLVIKQHELCEVVVDRIVEVKVEKTKGVGRGFGRGLEGIVGRVRVELVRKVKVDIGKGDRVESEGCAGHRVDVHV